MTLPLADIRVLAIEQYGAGPWGTLQLADLGAEVIKIEDPSSGGDVGRYVPPFQEGEDSLFFETFNRNKKSVSLDLRHPEARGVVEDLVRAVDAVYSNLRGDQPKRLRLTYEDLAEVNPRIVCCSLSGFGMTGPRAGEGGYDYMMQGLAGWMSLTGEPDGPPTKSGLSLVDLSGGYVSAIALLAGLWRARRDGIGCDCDVSLFETALHELMYVGTWVASRGFEPERLSESAHPSIVPFQNFQTADGWIVVACPKQKFWERALRSDRADGPRDRLPLRRLRRAASKPRGARARASACVRDADDERVAGRSLGGRRAQRARERRRGGARRAAGRRQGRDRRDRAPAARDGAPGRHAAPRGRGREARPSERRPAASTPSRCSSTSAATPPSACASSPPPASSGTSLSRSSSC